MTNIDQFESVFRSAAKEPFALQDVSVTKILYICDQDESSDDAFLQDVKRFLATAELMRNAEWEWLSCTNLDDVDTLMQRIKTRPPDLICTYRNLHIPATEYPYCSKGI